MNEQMIEHTNHANLRQVVLNYAASNNFELEPVQDNPDAYWVRNGEINEAIEFQGNCIVAHRASILGGTDTCHFPIRDYESAFSYFTETTQQQELEFAEEFVTDLFNSLTTDVNSDHAVRIMLQIAAVIQQRLGSQISGEKFTKQ